MATTYHTYSNLIVDGGRLAATDWGQFSFPESVAATLQIEPDAIILRATHNNGHSIRALAPGGMSA